MAINSISLNRVSPNIASSVISPTDTETKNISNQITNKRQSLNRLASDSEMSAEEKAKERQEIQKQIAELNQKLRMLRMEKKEEEKKAEKVQEQKTVLNESRKEESPQEEADKDTTVEATKEQREKVSISPQSVQKILEAGTLLKKERILQNVDQKKEAMGSILEAEIKSDEIYGTDTSEKKEKLFSLIKEKPFELQIEEKQEPRGVFPKNSSAKIIIRDDII